MAKPLVLDLHIPYCIRPENYLAHFNAVGSNAEKNAYMDALKREVLSYESCRLLSWWKSDDHEGGF